MPVAFVGAEVSMNFNTSDNSSLTVQLPVAADGDLILVEITGYGNGTLVFPDFTTPNGWTELGHWMDDNGTPASAVHIFFRVKQAGDPAAVTLNWSQPGQMVAVARAYSGAGGISDTTFWNKSSSDNAYSIAVDVSQSGWLLYGFANRTGSPWSAMTDTERAQAGLSSSSTMVSRDTNGDVAPGNYTKNAVGSSTSVGVAWGYVLVPGDVFVPPALTPVQQWIANPPMYAAHRGGSSDWPESSMFAYDQAAAFGVPALEASVWRSSDGVWVISHDRSTLRTHGVDYDITLTDWATLSTLRSINGGYPLARLGEALAAHPDKVWLVDNKQDTNNVAFMDFLDANGGREKIIVKGYRGANQATYARARDYDSWGYYYEGDILTTQNRCSLLGMDDQASSAAWDAIKAYGKPVLAHVVNDQADFDAAQAQSADGMMLSKVTLVYSNEPSGPKVYVIDSDGVTRHLVSNIWVIDSDGSRHPVAVRFV